MSMQTPALSQPDFQLPKSHEAFVRANRVIPGGVNSPARAFGAVGGEPPFMARAEGAYLYDIDGHQYIDYIGSWGPMILGHGHPEVKRGGRRGARARARASGARRSARSRSPRRSSRPCRRSRRSGSSRRGPRRRCRPCGWRAGVTGRDKIVKMTGHYHGHVDALLVQAGSAATTLGTPEQPGRDRRARRHDTILCPFNDAAAVADAFAPLPRPDRRRPARAGRRQHGAGPAAARLPRTRSAS